MKRCCDLVAVVHATARPATAVVGGRRCVELKLRRHTRVARAAAPVDQPAPTTALLVPARHRHKAREVDGVKVIEHSRRGCACCQHPNKVRAGWWEEVLCHCSEVAEALEHIVAVHVGALERRRLILFANANAQH